MKFPDGFAWGVATASYQIEGSPLRAGGGRSVWDMFCEREGAIANGESGWTACDHYERYRGDVALMKQLGVKAYRLSLSWPRIMPDGEGAVSEDGIGFYDRLIDELLSAGIEPWVTLFHWDYPYALYNRGGWLNPKSSIWFEKYTRAVVERLSDRVTRWMTLNEPQCFIGLGHMTGIHAPGDKLQLSQVLLAAHNALLSHGRAVQTIRERSKAATPTVGFAPVGTVYIPETDSADDIAAAREATFRVSDATLWNNTWFLGPVFDGSYPEDGLRVHGKDSPKPAPGDMELIAQPLDFFGTNVYWGFMVKAGKSGEPVVSTYAQGIGRTTFGWPVTPSALYWGPKFFYERYKKPIVVTENGMACSDWPAVDGGVHDAPRIDLTRRYLRELSRSHTEAGVDVRGYFHWSLMDNFEWAEGYRQRFGMVYVDYATQERIPKDSARWYKGVIESNGANL